MKKIFLLFTIVVFIFPLNLFSQNNVPNKYLEALRYSSPEVIQTDSSMVMRFVEEVWEVKKGDEILICLPASNSTDYLYVSRKGINLNTKLMKAITDIAKKGVIAVGMGSKNSETISKSLDMLQKVEAVGYGADALFDIKDLAISKKAKQIAGKRALVTGWNIRKNEYMLNVKIGKKKYEIVFPMAIMLSEIKLIDKKSTSLL